MCTGNICRSPMAEALLRRDLDERGIDATVSSAGLLDLRRGASDEVVELMKARGLDVRGHVSRRMTAAALASADLVLGMAREHVREAALLRPEVLARSFTLKEIVRRGHEAGPRVAGEELDPWLARLAPDRRPGDLVGTADADDIADPIGRRFGVYKKTAAEIERLTAELVALAFP